MKNNLDNNVYGSYECAGIKALAQVEKKRKQRAPKIQQKNQKTPTPLPPRALISPTSAA